MIKKLLLSLLVLLVFSAVGVFCWLRTPQFGRSPSAARKARMTASPQWRNERFQRFEPIEDYMTPVPGEENTNVLVAWWKFLTTTPPDNKPKVPVPSAKTDLRALPADLDCLVWMGHSSFYMQLGGKKILVDPVFCGHGSPLSFITRAFPGSDAYTPDDIPELDALLISHDHWDHLDYETLRALRPKVKSVVCGLGVGEYFEYWGFDAKILREQDWFEEVDLDGLKIVVLPAEHFSQRLFKADQAECVSFAFIVPGRRVFYSGDSGYAGHFKLIGEKYGPFDLAVIENGQYNERWHVIHMFPEEGVNAALDLGARAVMPVHSGKFSLAPHPWYEPLERFSAAAADRPFRLLTPIIGEVLRIGDETQVFAPWWKKIM